MPVFASLTRLREFEKAHLPFVQHLADIDIISMVGAYQARRRPLSLHDLLGAGIGAASTVNRRLTRLRKAGHLVVTPDRDDVRKLCVVLSPALYQICKRYGRLLTKVSAQA